MNQFCFKNLLALTPAQLEWLVTQAQAVARLGRLPEHIPLLSEADPAWFALQIQSIEGQALAVGRVERSFALMSVVKPFLLLFLLEQLGMDAVFSRVGKLPSSYPFNSLAQLEADQGWARNPMINSGAIGLASLLPGHDAAARCETLRQWLNQLANCQLYLDEQVLASVRSLKNEMNWKIAQRLAQAGYLTDIAVTLDTYNHICCLAGTVADLTNLGLLLVQPLQAISLAHPPVVHDIMLTCGLYEASKDFALQVGLPTKSGVSGALLTVIPAQGAIACYSPPLDRVGNSIGSLFTIEQLQRMMTI